MLYSDLSIFSDRSYMSNIMLKLLGHRSMLLAISWIQLRSFIRTRRRKMDCFKTSDDDEMPTCTFVSCATNNISVYISVGTTTWVIFNPVGVTLPLLQRFKTSFLILQKDWSLSACLLLASANNPAKEIIAYYRCIHEIGSWDNSATVIDQCTCLFKQITNFISPLIVLQHTAFCIHCVRRYCLCPESLGRLAYHRQSVLLVYLAGYLFPHE